MNDLLRLVRREKSPKGVRVGDALPDAHTHHAVVPPLDDLPRADGELERLPAVQLKGPHHSFPHTENFSSTGNECPATAEVSVSVHGTTGPPVAHK